MDGIETLTNTTFQTKALEAPRPVVIDFYQASCAPCRTLEPRLERVAYRFRDAIAVHRVDVGRDLAIPERFSEHPLARAVVEAAERDALTIPAAEDFSVVSGRGVTAGVEGHRVAIGSPKFVASQGADLTAAGTQIEALQSAGKTVVAFGADSTLAAQKGMVTYRAGMVEQDGIREAIIERGFKVVQA